MPSKILHIVPYNIFVQPIYPRRRNIPPNNQKGNGIRYETKQ